MPKPLIVDLKPYPIVSFEARELQAVLGDSRGPVDGISLRDVPFAQRAISTQAFGRDPKYTAFVPKSYFDRDDVLELVAEHWTGGGWRNSWGRSSWKDQAGREDILGRLDGLPLERAHFLALALYHWLDRKPKWKVFDPFWRALRAGTLQVDPVECQKFLPTHWKHRFMEQYQGWTAKDVQRLLEEDYLATSGGDWILKDLAKNVHLSDEARKILLSFTLKEGWFTGTIRALAETYPSGARAVLDAVRAEKISQVRQVVKAWGALWSPQMWSELRGYRKRADDLLCATESPREYWPEWHDVVRAQWLDDKGKKEGNEGVKSYRRVMGRVVRENPAVLDVIPELVDVVTNSVLLEARDGVTPETAARIDRRLGKTVRGVRLLARDGVAPTEPVPTKVLARALAGTSRTSARARSSIVAALPKLRGT